MLRSDCSAKPAVNKQSPPIAASGDNDFEIMKNLTLQPTPTQSPTPSTQTQYPPGYLGFEYPLILGIAIGVVVGSLRNKPEIPSVVKQSEVPVSSDELVPIEVNRSPSTGLGQAPLTSSGLTAVATAKKEDWTDNLIKQTALIWGNQGGGKSWLARYSVKLKLQAGYRVIVLDPDSNRSEWIGVESYHSWEDIKTQIEWYNEELQARLSEFNSSSMNDEQWQSKLLADGRAVAFVVEEATTYSSFIKNEALLETFGKLALTKSRKQLMPITVVSHNNTQSCLFGIKGLGNLVSKMLQVECLAEVNKETLKPQSTGKGKLKLDSSNEWLEVKLPDLKTKITDFTSYSKQQVNTSIKQTELPEIVDTVPTVDNCEPQQNWIELANKVYESCKGKGEVVIKRLPSHCNAIREYIRLHYESQNLDDSNQLKDLHIIIGVLVSEGRAKFINPKLGKYGDVVQDKDNVFLII